MLRLARFATASLVLLAGAWSSASAARAADPLPRYRWLYLMTNFQVTENVAPTEALIKRASAAGYNGVVLADYKLNILDRVPEHYFTNLERVQRSAEKLELELIPTVAPFGYSDGILAHDPNLAEGLPARDVPLRVHGEFAELDSTLGDALPGGDFETRKGDTFAGWDYQDLPGKATFADPDQRHGGAMAMRIESPGANNPDSGNARVSRLVKVRRWGQYHASVWIKTQGFQTAGGVRLFALSPAGRTLSYNNLGVKPDQDWTEHHAIFNSLDNDEVRLYAGVWSGGAGQLWLDDVRLEETAFVNLLRRPGCPLAITDARDRECREGVDFEELRDPQMGVVPWSGSFEVYHRPPRLRVLKGGKLKNGDALRASFFHAVTIYDNQVPCSLTEPKVFDVLEGQLREVERCLKPRIWFLSHDEIRVANWRSAEVRNDSSAGQALAENVRKCVELVRKVGGPNAKLCFWSDMFDASHNAVKDFYLVNGDLAGSWEGLPADAIVMNWNSGKAGESLPWFAGRGHKQILAGYYDSAPANIRTWLNAARSVEGVEGVMYTTWQHRFDDLEAFARHAWGGPPPALRPAPKNDPSKKVQSAKDPSENPALSDGESQEE